MTPLPTMRRLCLLGVFLTTASLGRAEDWRSLVQKPYENLKIPDLGLTPLAARTKSEWEATRKTLHAHWQERLGKAPPKTTNLDVRIEADEPQTGYRRLLVSFSTEGEDRLRAYLLLPEGLKPGEKRPAAVVFHPTTNETLREPAGLGKRQEMALAVQLVGRGYIALAPECYIMKAGGPKAQAAALAERHPGWTGLGKMTFDASRCLDYLETLPQVDIKRVGAIGHSLGAKEVLYALAFEPRYAVGVFNEGGIGIRMSNWTDPWYLTERMKSHIPTLEHHQVMALVAPRPLLILGGDSADGDASWPFLRATLPVYELLGAGDRLGLHNHKAKHTFPREARRLSYRWMDTWLGHTPVRDEAGP